LALDEPSGGLDPGVRRTVLDLLKGLPQTMIIASHDLGFVHELCDRLVVLDNGQIVDNGSPEKLLAWL
jgi:cobalt/nickel transport system ATP-binding protein